MATCARSAPTAEIHSCATCSAIASLHRHGAQTSRCGRQFAKPRCEALPGGAANAALMLATIGLARHYARCGIRINGINLATKLTERVELGLQIEVERLRISREEALARWQAGTPMRRYGEASEIADVALFLVAALGGGTLCTCVEARPDGGLGDAVRAAAMDMADEIECDVRAVWRLRWSPLRLRRFGRTLMKYGKSRRIAIK